MKNCSDVIYEVIAQSFTIYKCQLASVNFSWQCDFSCNPYTQMTQLTIKIAFHLQKYSSKYMKQALLHCLTTLHALQV